MPTRIDGAGLAKLETLEAAVTLLQRLHAVVERMGAAAQAGQDTSHYRQQIQRAAAPLVGLLKPQFGIISDTITTMVLITTRGGGEKARIRALREAVAHTRAALDAASSRVRDQHTVEIAG